MYTNQKRSKKRWASSRGFSLESRQLAFNYTIGTGSSSEVPKFKNRFAFQHAFNKQETSPFEASVEGQNE
jgi:hypothetical protein